MSGILLATVGNSYGSAPVNTVAPAVTGTASFGSTLTTTNGTWTGAPAPTFTYQWQRVTTNISGATSSTYVLVAADVGNTIRCVVRATNSVAPSGVTANSNSTASVAAVVPGAPTIGTATATGSSTATVVYTAPASDGGATITSYTATSSPAGGTGTLSQAGSGTITVTGLSPLTSYTFTVTATNSAGTSAASAASNSITTSDSYFFASLASDVYGYDIAIDSSANIYQGNNLGPGASKSQVVKLSNTGVIQWQNQMSSTDVSYPSVGFAGMTVNKSTGDAYAVGNNSASGTNNAYIWKYNSSGTLQWQKVIGDASNTTYVAGTGAGTLAVDSGGNLVSVMSNLGNKAAVMKLNSSGATVWQSILNNPGGFSNTQADCIDVDTSDNVVFAGYVYDSGFTMLAGKFNSSGTAQWATRIASTPSSFFSGWGRGVGTDSSGNVYVASQAINSTAMICKFDSAGYVLWIRNFGAGSGFDVSPRDMAVDSSGNSYTLVGGGGQLFIVKYNSSGVIQWQRQLATSISSYFQPQGITLNAGGTIFYINSRPNGAVNENICTKLPTDGSYTGTYTVSAYTYIYSASSLADAAATYADTALTPNGGSFSRTNTTSTLVNAATSKTIAVTNV